jgi:hypothetical protein
MTMLDHNPPAELPLTGPAPRRLKRRWLPLAVGSALLLAAGGAGTFATFTASTTNSNATFATGTLVLEDKVGATVCLSTGGSNTDTNANSTGCSTFINLNTKKPGDAATTVDLDLTNKGSIGATQLEAFAPSACATADRTGESYHGSATADLCTPLKVTVAEFANDTDRQAGTPISSCRYGGASCALDTAKNLANYSLYTDAAPLQMSTIGAGATRFFRLTFQLDSGAGNIVQGKEATFSFSWRLQQ